MTHQPRPFEPPDPDRPANHARPFTLPDPDRPANHPRPFTLPGQPLNHPRPFTLPDPDRLLDTALRLAATGHPVFPCVPGAKRPLTSHGLHDASTDPHQIRAWWRRWPTANLAVPTGSVSWDVLDVDVHTTGTGFPALHRLVDAGMTEAYARHVITPSGGVHQYFIGTKQPSSRLPALHLDFKASGGYVLTPPSVVNGRPYDLISSTPEPHRPLNWAQVRNLLTPHQPPSPPAHRPSSANGIRPLADWVARLPEGQRNVGTFWAANRAIEQGISDLQPLVDAAVTAGLPRREATRTITSAIRRATTIPHPALAPWTTHAPRPAAAAPAATPHRTPPSPPRSR